MQLGNSARDYGAIAKAFHWSAVLLILAGWALGTLGDDLPRGAARNLGLFIHISAGVIVLALFAPRLGWRLIDAPPQPEPSPFGPWVDRLAAWAHYALYALLLAAPLAGIAVQFARGDALPILGIFDIPSPWLADRASARVAKEVHEFLANALVVLAGMHAAAALFHHWVLRDRTLTRMLPGAR